MGAVAFATTNPEGSGFTLDDLGLSTQDAAESVDVVGSVERPVDVVGALPRFILRIRPCEAYYERRSVIGLTSRSSSVSPPTSTEFVFASTSMYGPYWL